MEHIHGVDVSWMTHGNPKDKAIKAATRQQQRSSVPPQQIRDPSTPSRVSPSPTAVTTTATTTNGHEMNPLPSSNAPASPGQEPPSRPGFARGYSSEKNGASPPPGSSPSRRSSWFSNISSKFSSGGAAAQSPPQANASTAKQTELSVPKANPVKNAVLQHAAKYEGDGPYTPAPPKSSQPGILQVFRRLSATNGGGLVQTSKGQAHGLVERRVLNVDHNRERCPISELHQAKLRRVAFCVDVEIAPMPKYADAGDVTAKSLFVKKDKTQKRKMTEKGEGEALKHPKVVENQKEQDGQIKVTGEELPKEPESEGIDTSRETEQINTNETKGAVTEGLPPGNSADAKKKEKKKKSEEERKARKEKKRKLAEANGSIPMEIHPDSDSSGMSTTATDGQKMQAVPTTNPVRIYRRCCQLRETPILKKITEQLTNNANCSAEPGMVEKLDLTGYWMQLADLVTLGDYLAVVPVKEVILENCGLTDEGLRVILAGLLAAKRPENKKRKHISEPDGLTPQGGVVERLVLKNNKLGPEGWMHICLFIYLCRSLKCLDLSSIAFPQPTKRANNANNGQVASDAPALSNVLLQYPQYQQHAHLDLCQLFAKSLTDRLGGSTLSLLNLGETGLNTEQLGAIMEGITKCGVKRVGLAHNNINAEGVQHIAKYLRIGKCDGLDLGGNDMRDQLGVLANALTETDPLWALSLAECNLTPSSLCKLLPRLSKLQNFRFIDLSHNHELFNSDPSALSVLRRYLPKIASLKRIHLADCAMSSEQAIALAEVLPEVPGLAHIIFLENPEIARLTDAKTEETQEEACALFTSLLAATRVSTSLVCVDIEVPSEQSSELVKALAKQVVAYCLRNMERLPVSEIAAAALAQTEASARQDPEYPDVLQHLVGHDVMGTTELNADADAAPDDDYVIGGTGVVKALACCLKNRGDESRRQSGEFIRDVENGTPLPRPNVPAGKAKDMSKHLLSSARKIRQRLQPAITKAKAASNQDTHAYFRLLFLDNTLRGIIKRFEDEFPDTRESGGSAMAMSPEGQADQQLGTSSFADADLPAPPTAGSDAEDEADFIKPPLSRTNSAVSMTSKALAEEEGRVLRAGHKFRSGLFKPEHYMMLSGLELVGADPNHVRILHEMLEELNDPELKRRADNIGVVRVFQEERDAVLQKLKDADPEHWERFAESQMMATKNLKVGAKPVVSESAAIDGDPEPDRRRDEEEALAD